MATGLCGTCGGSMPGCGCYVTAVVDGGIDVSGDGSSGSPFALSARARRAPGSPLVVNGGMRVWQMGTSVTPAAGGYSADQWIHYTRSDIVVSRQLANDTKGSPYCMRLQRPNGNSTTTSFGVGQSHESANSLAYAGRQCTYVVRARKGSGSSITLTSATLYSGTGTDQSVGATGSGFTGTATVGSVASPGSLSTSWQDFIVTATPGASITQLGQVLTFGCSGTAGASDYVEIKDVDVLFGGKVYEREQRTYRDELAECLRFFWRSGGVGSVDLAGVGLCTATTTAAVMVPFLVQMRAVPTLAVGGVAAFTVTDGSVANASSAVALAGATSSSKAGVLFTTTGLTVGRAAYVYANSTSGYLDFIARI